MTAIIILAILGIVFVLLELVLPGAILGIGGVLCLIAAVVLTFVDYGPMAGMIAVGALLVFGFFSFGLWMRFFHRLPFARNLILEKSISDPSKKAGGNPLLGQEGLALTPISPSGFVDLSGEKRDVISESGRIEKGARVRVVDVRGPSLFVEEILSGEESS